MKCTLTYQTMLQGRRLPCDGEMMEVGGINKQYQYLNKDGVVCGAEVILYQCEVCKAVKLV